MHCMARPKPPTWRANSDGVLARRLWRLLLAMAFWRREGSPYSQQHQVPQFPAATRHAFRPAFAVATQGDRRCAACLLPHVSVEALGVPGDALGAEVPQAATVTSVVVGSTARTTSRCTMIRPVGHPWGIAAVRGEMGLAGRSPGVPMPDAGQGVGRRCGGGASHREEAQIHHPPPDILAGLSGSPSVERSKASPTRCGFMYGPKPGKTTHPAPLSLIARVPRLARKGAAAMTRAMK